jgi:hypothetical protein
LDDLLDFLDDFLDDFLATLFLDDFLEDFLEDFLLPPEIFLVPVIFNSSMLFWPVVNFFIKTDVLIYI